MRSEILNNAVLSFVGVHYLLTYEPMLFALYSGGLPYDIVIMLRRRATCLYGWRSVFLVFVVWWVYPLDHPVSAD